MEDSHKSIRIFLAILRALICYILISLATRLSHYFVSMLLAEMLDEGMVSNRFLSLFSASCRKRKKQHCNRQYEYGYKIHSFHIISLSYTFVLC